MARTLNPHQHMKKALALRQQALERNELRGPATPHVSAAGPTSAPIKLADPSDALLIEAYLRQKRGDA